jgi:hypothetical protein
MNGSGYESEVSEQEIRAALAALQAPPQAPVYRRPAASTTPSRSPSAIGWMERKVAPQPELPIFFRGQFGVDCTVNVNSVDIPPERVRVRGSLLWLRYFGLLRGGLLALKNTGSMSARRKRGRYRRFRLGLAERAVKQPVPAITT